MYFNCDDKYCIGHKYKAKFFKMFMGRDELIEVEDVSNYRENENQIIKQELIILEKGRWQAKICQFATKEASFVATRGRVTFQGGK